MVRSAGRKRKSHGGIRLDSISNDGSNVPTKGRKSTKKSSKLTLDQERLLASFDLAYNELPTELMSGYDLDLSMWTIIVYDKCLAKMAVVQSQTNWPQVSNQQLNDDEGISNRSLSIHGLQQALRSPSRDNGGVKLNLKCAEQITDVGVRHIITALSTRLESLNLSRTTKLTDMLVRWIATMCTNLKVIDLSHMRQLSGIGVGAIGEGCPLLEVVCLNGCSLLPEVALLKIAYGCLHLAHFDISQCCNATDLVMRTLGTSNKNLKNLFVHGCKEISDTGMLALTKGCKDMLQIDLSRSDFHYKITDMALLSLAENCKILQHVNLSGCDYLTDAGLSWLASGCSALTHLDISLCVKLTDLALPSICCGCPRMSDIGLRYISNGCRELITLRLRSTILVSDGGNYTHENPQGMAALAYTCKRLQYLDLTKCIRINDLACKQIAHGFHDLRTLSLFNCGKISSDGIQDISRHCKNLSQLDLTECKLIDDHAICAMGLGLHHLQTLKLRGCDHITTLGIQKLCAGCHLIQTLDLAGCHRIDDMALLSISENLSDIRHLWLVGMPHISIIGISWLADRCLALMELDVSGSAITYAALKPLRGAWKYGELHERNKMRGIFPKYRSGDMIFLDYYGTCWKAAIRIQCLYRAKVAKREAARRREEALINWAASKMQSVYRGRQARLYAQAQRIQRLKEHEAAKKIQAAYRAMVARTILARLRKQRERDHYIQMVMRVQSAWRQKSARNILKSKQMIKEAIERARTKAAIVIQAAYHSYRWRVNQTLFTAARKLKKLEEEAAANKMQNLFRGRAARLEAQRKREALKLLHGRKDQASMCLQRAIRRRRERRFRSRQEALEAKQQAAAIRIQKRYRLRQQMLSYQMMKLAQEFHLCNAAALRLQAAWRRKQGHLARHMLRVLKDDEHKRRSEAATKLQTRWRGRAGRAKAAAAQLKAIEKLAMKVKMENILATRLQAHWRGKKGRQRYRDVLNARKRRWKEVPNTEDGTKVYFHQDTGEIRHRMPQDLLDLLPKIICNDCGAYNIAFTLQSLTVLSDKSDASIECGDCGEYFCRECWLAIHAGGRRRRHRFRALYDFYDKRIDYGDGEFPSVWPSEIEQDDLDGWFLRKSPFREPSIRVGDWEKYVDETTHREWYYNSQTKCSTYIPPDCFKASAEDIEMAWIKKEDVQNHVTYYVNEKTGQRTFERPPKYVDQTEPLEEVSKNTLPDIYEEAPNNATTEKFAVDLGNGWMQYWDETYQVYYYYNTVTQESTYIPPESIDSIVQ